MFKTIIVVWLALLVLALYVFTSVTRIIEKRRPTPPSHSAQKKNFCFIDSKRFSVFEEQDDQL
jgi:hypothetical protein